MNDLNDKIANLSAEQRLALKQLLAARAQSGEAPMKRAAVESCGLSPPQTRLWILSELDGASSAYNIPAVFRLKGALDRDALASALSDLSERHEILRTTFDADADGRPFQRVSARTAIDFETLQAEPAADQEATIDRVVRETLGQAFDLRRGPTWRARLLALGADEHVLILSLHHIVFDGWSLGVLAREMFVAYDARCRGARPAFPALEHQYSDYVAWRAQTDEAAERGQAEFWRRTLDGALAVLDLPADRARPATPSYRGSIVKRVIAKDVFDRIVAVAREQGATPYSAFLALFKIALHRYTGDSDLIVGTPVSGRERAEIQSLIGVFVNTLPIRTEIAPGISFREAIARVHGASLAAFEHQRLSFDAIVEATNPDRIAGVNPIFQTLYTYQNALAPIAAGALDIAYLDVDCGTSKFDLSLDVFEGVDGPTCIFEYSADLFERERIDRLAAHFAQLAEAAVAAPDAPVSGLRMLTERELDDVRGRCAATVAELRHPSLLALIGERCAQFPENIAVRDGDRSLSYRELDAAAETVAHALRARGVAKGAVVGVNLPRSADLIVAIYGAMKAGAAFVGLDPTYPLERLAHIVRDAELACVIRNGSGTAELETEACAVLDLDALDTASAVAPSAASPALELAAEDLAYLVYTSGSTGVPKGVAITHGNCVNAYQGWERAYDLPSTHAHLQMASLPFDVFCGDFIRALGSGKTMVICPQTLFAEPDAMYELMKRERTDLAEFVPGVFRNLAEYLFARGKKLDFMKVLIVASDAWYAGEYREYRKLISADAMLVNSYGMAEATVDTTYFNGDAADLPSGAQVPVGIPFTGVGVLICDANMQLLPDGVSGEICVFGAGVGRGYIHRDELTAERFVDRPPFGEFAGRVYRTGDVGRIGRGGVLELTGRKDSQIKIRGMRVELGEIEMALRTRAGFRDCAAVAVDGVGGPRIVAYVVDDAQAPLAAHAINDLIGAYLPQYMLPEAYVRIDAIPYSPNGKVDKRRLPSAEGTSADLRRSFVSPRTLNEEMMATIFGQVFRVPRVGIHDDFFALGGHSLLAFQVVSRIRETFKVDLNLQALFANPTIAGLAQHISDLQGTRAAYDETVNSLPTAIPDVANRDLPFPLTDIQQAYWLGRNDVFEFGNVTTHSYDEMETYEIDVARFQNAWNDTIARHDMLRAIILRDGTQRIMAEVPEYEVRVLDLRECDESGVQAGIQSVRDEMSHQMLDVHTWPVFDIRVTLLPGGVARIHFSSDALIFDVWSFVIIIDELVQKYLTPELVLPKLDLSFRDYVIAEEKLRETERYAKAKDYWRKRVENLAPAPILPMAKDPSELKTPKFTRLHAELDRDAWNKLKQKAVRAGLTTTGLMLAAYAEVLSAYSRSPAFSLNLTFLSRQAVHPQVNEIVGEFTSLCMLGVDQSLHDTFTARARKLQGDLWNDLEHHAMSGVQVLREMTRSRGGATRAKFPVVFTSALVVPIPKRHPDFPIVPVYREGVTQTSQVWLDGGVWEDEGILRCNWDVVLELYPDGMIQTMFDAFWRLVGRLAHEDEIWHQDVLELVEQPLAEISAPLCAEQTLDSLFLDSLARAPDAPAVIQDDTTLSYRDLAGHAAWVSEALRGEGVRTDQLVAVAMRKGWEQVAAVLGVVNSGGAYLPIDPELPSGRIETLLTEGGARIVVTTPDLADEFSAYALDRVIVLQAGCVADPETLRLPKPHGCADLAYVIFTSGSTGKPKGVAIEHRGAVNTILDVNREFAVGASDRVLALSALNFDLSVYDIFGILHAGGAIVMPNKDRRLDPIHWAELCRQHNVTLWNSVPALCGLMVDYLERSNSTLTSMRQVMLSGDWIAVTLPARIRGAMPNTAVMSLGGATEASIWSIWYPIEEVGADWTSIPYGKPMTGQDLRVLDHRLEPCANWVTGDLYIAGIGLARCYWNDPKRTDASFIVHPRTGERLYRTGDTGRMLPDGNIEFLGREDQQVKVQGHRIELGEIEAALQQHPAVRDAVVACQGERLEEKRLFGFYCVNEGFDVEPAQLKSFLAESLPEYMVPAQMQPIEAIPLSANGKVDRAALPTLQNQQQQRRGYVAPDTPVEETICGLWQQLLETERVGVDSDFFALGGDSMLAIKLLVALQQEFRCEVPLRDVFLKPTVRGQAVLMEQLSAAARSLAPQPQSA